MIPSPPPPPLPQPPGERSSSTASSSPPSSLHHPNSGLSLPPTLSSLPSSPSPTSAIAILPLLPLLLPLYLPDRDDFDALTPTSPLPLLLSAFTSLFAHHRDAYLHPVQIERHHRVLLPFPLLTRHAQPLCPDFQLELKDDPGMVLPILSAAAHIAVLTLQQRNLLHTRITPSTPLTARLLGHTPLTSLRAVRSHLWTKLVTFRANVVKVGAIKHLPLLLSFSCVNCSTERPHRLKDGRYSEPRDFCQCPPQFRGKLRVDRTRMQAQDWQQVRIQEIVAGAEYNERTIAASGDAHDERKDQQEGSALPDGVRGGGGLIPRYFECELRGDLVDACMPGDVIVVTGVIKPSQVESWGSRGDRRSSKKEWQLFLDVNAVNTLTRHAPLSHHLSWISFEEEDVRKLMRVLEDTQGRPFDHLVHSLCPAIYGHDIVKQGLLLTLFGGNADAASSSSNSGFPSASSATRSPRWNSHVLVVGDPGLGKSQMLKAVNAVSPRGVLVTGNASSASGLTVTMLRENSVDSDFALEAGALVLGDSGTTCIDEFDKLHPSQHSALLEAMEQQTISIAKAGMIVSLPARTSIFAAANPVGGHYNRSKSVSENIQLSSPLLSRFDLVFVLVDDANESADQALSHHVMRLHANLAQGDQPRKRRKGEAGDGWTSLHGSLAGDASSAHRLPPLPPSLLRLYIAYARRYVHPVFTDEAKSALYHFYLSLRHAPCDGSSIITTRQLESLIRLAEARAKADLRSVVEEADALCVIQLMRESIGQVVMDEDGTMDWRRGGAGGRSREKEFIKLMKALQRKKREEGVTTFTRGELRAMGGDLGLASVDKAVQQLNDAGYLLQHQGDQFRFRESE